VGWCGIVASVGLVVRRKRRGLALAIFAITLAGLSVSRALAQAQPPSETFKITADNAQTWDVGGTHVVQLTGNVNIQTDTAKMAANNAVVWLTPVGGEIPGQQRVEIALIGGARLEHAGATRSADRLFVTADVRATAELQVQQRLPQDASDSPLYRIASDLRNTPPSLQPTQWLLTPAGTQPTTAPATQPVQPVSPVRFDAVNGQTTLSADGKLAYVLSGNVRLTQRRFLAPGAITSRQPGTESDLIELRADRAVVFTQLRHLRELESSSRFKTVYDAVYAAYLEGDVQITQSPGDPRKVANQLDAQRVYYDFGTDRAILTQAVIHSLEPQRQIPLIVRADTIRQLSMGEYRATHATLTTSSFAVPSYSIHASSAYVRQTPSDVPEQGNRVTFEARDATLRVFDVPFFYLPVIGGSMTERGGALRTIELGDSRNNGFGVRTEWGLFETFGQVPPENLDVWYNADFYSERGPASGLNADYQGGFITETTRQPWDFKGDVRSYFLFNDYGIDKLSRDRRQIDPSESFRGHFLWEHQHFFPEDWQVQFRYGWTSDPTFLEYWQQNYFNTGLPHDFEAYVKHQRDNEAYSILFQFQPNDVATTAEALNNAFPSPRATGALVEFSHPFEVERLPQLEYHRIGDSFGDDKLTSFSDVSVAGLRFNQGDPSLFDYGFLNANPATGREAVIPGFPALGQTGITNKTVYRGDVRQELDYPLRAGQFKLVPYVLGRYTAYSDSPDDGVINRVLVGAGVRVTTAFWKVDDSAYSDFLDVHRMRHVVEPELNLFTSVANYDRNDVFIYDDAIDDIHDVSVAQVGVRQRWQTKRGGPGNWRSVDFFTLDVSASFYANKPGDQMPPNGFRGLFFSSVPEESIPRDTIDAEAAWRVSDSTIVLADTSYNLNQMELATSSIGMAVQRDTHLSYFLGLRYIGQIDSTIGAFAANYDLSTKYAMVLTESFNFSQRSSDETTFSVIRKFDRFWLSVGVFYDAIEDDSGFRFAFYPEGIGFGVSTNQLQNVFGPQ
jgi:lipopolysaccharide assembly outer membrane protein LptD (OstA)